MRHADVIAVKVMSTCVVRKNSFVDVDVNCKLLDEFADVNNPN